MSTLHYITGAAGTGKTHRLGDELIRWAEVKTLAKHQSILALTRMHGSRKRLVERLGGRTTEVRLVIGTVDSFALSVVNRWRLSLGYDAPIWPHEDGGMLRDDIGHRANFGEVLSMAAQLLQSPIVAKTVSNSHPLILVDEFQDCAGHQLSIISCLKGFADLILAADPFQALDGNESACEWAEGCAAEQTTTITRLQECRRTGSTCLLEAAQALFLNEPARYSEESLPFFFAPRYAVAIWKVLPRLPRNQTAALIYPAHAALRNAQNATEAQNARRVREGKKRLWFPWHTQVTDRQLFETILSGFTQAIETRTWRNNGKWKKLFTQASHFARARGHQQPPASYLSHVVSGFVQARKFVGGGPLHREATTVHGAKNREFDHVFVLWDGNLCAGLSVERQRRLLYNAVTRARLSCTVVGLGTHKQLRQCPVLSLLGNPSEPFGA